MSSHVYHEIYLHFNWHTKGDLPLLHGDLEILTHRELQDNVAESKAPICTASAEPTRMSTWR